MRGDIEARVTESALAGSFTRDELEGLPEPARRFLAAAIAPGTPLAVTARLAMRSSIKLGKRWLAFRAHEVLAPHRGFVWAARVGGVMVGSDRFADGQGAMNWKLLGLVPVMRADGGDVSRSAAGRAGGEAIWVPTALLPRFGVTWTAIDDRHVTAQYRLDELDVELRIGLDERARIRSLVVDRWGDPDRTGTWGLHLFGLEVTGYATFDG
jgi:uncharacterized protein DUF6544